MLRIYLPTKVSALVLLVASYTSLGRQGHFVTVPSVRDERKRTETPQAPVLKGAASTFGVVTDQVSSLANHAHELHFHSPARKKGRCRKPLPIPYMYYMYVRMYACMFEAVFSSCDGPAYLHYAAWHFFSKKCGEYHIRWESAS
ncbi:hypothetical protein F4808DRAFT_192365 [Astrocystis sublimbata]|nr:hypothetical protein F4808DRAFT_192365 [Astrocystis sublimbata]